jgi:hypothetical protein
VLLLSQSPRVNQSQTMTSLESEELEQAPACDLPAAGQLAKAMSDDHYTYMSHKNQVHPKRVAQLVNPAIVVGALRVSPTLCAHWRLVESAELASAFASLTETRVGRMWIDLCDDMHDFATKAERVALTEYLEKILSTLGKGAERRRRLMAFVDAVERGADVDAADLPCDPLHEFDPDTVARLRELCVKSLTAECVKRASAVASRGRSEDCVLAATCEAAAVVLEAQAFAYRAPTNSLLDYNRMLAVCKALIQTGEVDRVVCSTGPVCLVRDRAAA